MMRIIFLDIDGVIATDMNAFNRNNMYGVYDWCEKPVKVLKEIMDETNAEIVLSSDWRLHYDMHDMRDMMFNHGLDGSKLIGFTPYHISSAYGDAIFKGRANEIVDWIKQHTQKFNPYVEIDSVENMKWVAVDDLNMSEYLTNFVHMTNTALGLADPGKKEEMLKFLL